VIDGGQSLEPIGCDQIVTANKNDVRSDRCILQCEFDKIQAMLPKAFSFDACANDSGDNAMCAKFASVSHSFLDTNVRGHTVWLNPPFARITQFVRHYLQCKAGSPGNTSACILIPAWHGKHRKLLQGMQLLHRYETGHVLFNAPTSDGGRQVMPGIPWPVEIWYDAPGNVVPVSLQVASTAQALTFKFLGDVAGCKAHVLLDSGATHNFISSDYAKLHGLRVAAPGQAYTVKLASGDTVALQGQCTFKLQLQSFSGTVTALVMPELLPDTDLILGDAWLRSQNATMCFETGTCKLHKGGRVRTLSLALGELPQTEDQVIHHLLASMLAAHVPPPIITGKQAQKAIRKGANHFTVVVQQEPASLCNTMMCSPKSVRRTDVQAAAAVASGHNIQALLDKYSDVFADLPPGLPPARNVAHTIPLEPGARPPAKRMYRLSPAELVEVKKQISDLLAKGFIEPSTGPYGSPILFVQKADGSLRMVIDYRALNKITRKNRYPLPRIEDLFDSLQGAKVFSSLDLQSGYHQIRIADEDVEKSAFVTPVGAYQFRVLAFGLANSPAIFSKAMADIFKDCIGKFVCVYLDDILVYSKDEHEHVKHLEIVLALLRKHKLYAKLSKCDFQKQSLKFLGHIVSDQGLQVDHSKVAVINEWPRPQTIKEVRSFLGLANYFRRFVQGYSSLVAPMIHLTKQEKLQPEDWTEQCEKSFTDVKALLTNAPVLAIPNPDLPYVVISDASVNGTGALLMQEGRVCAYTSKKFIPAERNYTTTEQELLGVIHALQAWRCYLEGCVELTLVTDHNPLIYLQEQPHLSRRQARWQEFLSRFHYEWQYRPGRNNIADPISRNPALLAYITRSKSALQGQAPESGSGGLIIDKAVELAGQASTEPRLPQTQTGQASAGPRLPQTGQAPSADAPQTAAGALLHDILAGYETDTWFTKAHVAKLTRHIDGTWRKDNRIVVPNSTELKMTIMKECHDSPVSGHVGHSRTQNLVERNFWWPGLYTDVLEYVRTCDLCQRNKPTNQKPGGLLQPLPIPARRWESISMDLITALPKTSTGKDAIVVFVDRLSKMTHFQAITTDIGAQGLADVFLDCVVKHHGVPSTIISDRDPRFTSKFWQAVMTKMGTSLKMSTAFHPQTDGQTERMNRVLEDMLRNYVDPCQDDWDKHLPMAEFAVNNSFNQSTKSTPFYLNFGEHPRTPLDLQLRQETNPAAKLLCERIQENIKAARQYLQQAQQRMATSANRSRRVVSYQVGDEVMLNTKNIRMKAVGTPKLLPRWVGPFNVSTVISKVAMRLDLPTEWKIHNAFHVSLLKPYERHSRCQPLPVPLRFEEGAPVFEVDRILEMRTVKRGKRTSKEYLVKWLGFTQEHNTYEPEANLKGCQEALADFVARSAR
jgi:Reverse transcriptase (RNA-dependent DNA polymerase)/RNase H-like domain found in reverse transcriptase/Integrase zinc binding domain/Chromo (CHRromatin Organisation MOdifier) domain/Retroviral aspartyl protease